MSFSTRPEILASRAAVSTTHWLASTTALGVLQQGGNAFDAAAAAGFVMQVAEPHMNGPAGEVPILLYSAAERRVRVIAGQGPAPAAATIEAFFGLGLSLVPGSGVLAAVVPGAFDAWMLLLRDYGRRTLREVLSPAAAYARNGIPVTSAIHQVVDAARPLFVAEWSTSEAVYLTRGNSPAVGSRFRNLALAETYERIIAEAESAGADRIAQIEKARQCWYKGFVAEAIDAFLRTETLADVGGTRSRGLLTGDDLAGWHAAVEDPVTLDYHGLTVCKCGPWTQGPVYLQQLAMLKHFDLNSMNPLGVEFAHTVLECAKLAFADRETFYGDPSFVHVPLETLLSEAYGHQRAKLVDDKASLAFRPGTIDGCGGQLDYEQAVRRGHRFGLPFGLRQEVGLTSIGEFEIRNAGALARGDTCHVAIADDEGNVIAATPSGGWLQSSPAVPGLGFPLSTRAEMFWLVPGLANSLAPGKRPRTTLTPTLVLEGGRPVLGFGTPGGDQQDQWSLLFFLRHRHHGMNLQESIDAAMFHTLHFPNSFWPREAFPGEVVCEWRLEVDTISGLQQRGHRVRVSGPWSLGEMCAVGSGGEFLKAAASARSMHCYAVGI